MKEKMEHCLPSTVHTKKISLKYFPRVRIFLKGTMSTGLDKKNGETGIYLVLFFVSS